MDAFRWEAQAGKNWHKVALSTNPDIWKYDWRNNAHVLKDKW